MPTGGSEFDRRRLMAGATAAATAPVLGAVVAPVLGSMLVAGPALAELAEMEAEIKKLVGAATVRPGRVKVEMPELTENGNSTSLAISVESPMTAANHVRALHIFSEKNPVAYIARLGLGPRSGRAKVATSIRVADSQTITVLAEMSDGSFWSGQGKTEVTTPACIDDSDRPR